MKIRALMLLPFLHLPLVCNAAQNWLNEMIVSKEVTPLQQGFFAHHTLVLFYSSTCPHCHVFAPILKAWSQNHNTQVLALSFDNEPLPEFPSFKPATTEWVNAAFTGRTISYPALFIANTQSKTLYPVAMGAMTLEELDTRMRALIPKIKFYEKKGANQ